MPHYTNLDVGKEPTRRVCKYCGRKMSVTSSMTQGCGDVCRMKHRNSRYRVIGKDNESRGGEGFKSFTDNSC